MDSERENFGLSGPLHLKSTDWKNTDYRRSVAASLVQGVYIIERDRQEKRQEAEALAPPWWQFFHFDLCTELIDDADSSIFGAIYEFKQPNSDNNHSANDGPHYVIAFRGTITKGDAFSRDFELDVSFIRNDLHRTSRFEIAIQAVRGIVATYGSSSIWLAGHSLGSAMAMLVGRSMAKAGVFLESYLFNPPYVSAPIERIKDKKVKHGIRIATSVITAGLAFAMKNNHQKHWQVDTFAALSEWIPCLFVNPAVSALNILDILNIGRTWRGLELELLRDWRPSTQLAVLLCLQWVSSQKSHCTFFLPRMSQLIYLLHETSKMLMVYTSGGDLICT